VRKAKRCVLAPLLAVCAGLYLVGLSPFAAGAEGAPHGASVSPGLQLFALEAELAAARTNLAALASERARVTADRASARRRLAAASTAVRASQRTLAHVLRELYATGETDPLAVVLGAESLDEAVSGIDALERSATQSRAVGEQARRARRDLVRLGRALAAHQRELEGLEADARRRRDGLAAAVEARRSVLAELARTQSAAAAATARHEAQAAERRSAELNAAAQPAAALAAVEVEAPQVVRGVRTLTVDAVAYSLPGRTASGLPVGRGVVAVDPTVIPLGTRMFVPGYGPAVAADVGTAVQGPIIDLWFPTLAEARAWGRRTVTISLR
jgi:peptidoglycan DL-endopeptidase CwlO